MPKIPETIQVMDSLRCLVSITPGVIDDAAIHVYGSGQCLALAIAISEHTGEPILLHLAPTGAGRVPVLVHAFTLTAGRHYVDINGAISEGELDARFWDGDVKFIVSAADLPEILTAYQDQIPEQNLEAARTFVKPVLSLVEQRRATT